MSAVVTLVLVAVAVGVVVALVRVRSQDPSRRPVRERREGWTAPATAGGAVGDGAGAGDEAGAGVPAARTAGVAPDVTPPPVPVDAVAPVSDRADPPPGRPLPELVQGLAWPHGLTPHVASDQPDTDRYLAMATTEATGPAVAAALHQELERLGYGVMALSEEDLVARRGEDLLSGRVHGRADAAVAGGRLLFPTAAADAVVVELWTGGGPSPRAS